MDQKTGTSVVETVPYALSSQELVSKNKRKAEPSLENSINITPSPTPFPHLLPLEKPQTPVNELSQFHVGSGDAVQAEEFELAEWDDPIACQLEELLFSSLRTIYQDAVKKIVECGYDEKVAEKSILRHALYNGGQDLVSNIVNDTLDLLKGGTEDDTEIDYMFENLEHLVQYTMLEMVSVLREVEPSLSVGEAMWRLLMCDLNISFASEVDRDVLHEFGSTKVPRESSSTTSSQSNLETQNAETTHPKPKESSVLKPSVPSSSNRPAETVKFGTFPHIRRPKSPLSCMGPTSEKESLVPTGAAAEYFQALSEASILEGKSGFGRKCRSKKEFAALSKKNFTVEKYRANGKGSLRTGRVASFGSFIVEKRIKPPSDVPIVHVKNASSTVGINSGSSVDKNLKVLTTSSSDVPVADNSSTVSKKDVAFQSNAGNTKLTESSSSGKITPSKSEGSTLAPKTTECDAEKEPASKSEGKTSVSCDTCDYYAGIPYDKSLQKYVPKNEKDELILKLVPRAHELQNELNSWTQWAIQKVMQATRRLSKDQPELKSLRQEKEEVEQLKTEKQMMEDNTMKRLYEMECAFNNATNQVESANSSLRRLEVEHSFLKEEQEAARLQASESAERCKEALERERKSQKDYKLSEGEKGLYQEELQRGKQKLAEFQQEVMKAKNLHNQIEARCEQEKMATEKLHAQAASIRKEHEQLEAAAKAEEEMIKRKAEKDMEGYCEYIKKLEREISELKMNLDSSKIDALRQGTIGGYANQIPSFSKGALNSQDNFAFDGLKREYECVMCLSEAKTVVFLPCVHQVLCVKCNELHEKQGMNDCPSCRTPIKQRIRVRLVRARQMSTVGR